MEQALPNVKRLREATKKIMQSIPNQMYVYAIEQMGEDIGAGPFRQQESGALSLRAPINQTNKLRFQTNRLGRALAPNESGNVSNVIVDGDDFIVEYGIDLSVVPYARIHEYGGTAGRGGSVRIKPRPYLRPAFQQFMKKQMPRIMQSIVKAIESK
jgi:phage gpG-like protein